MPNSNRRRVVLDTDTYNEVDDQFALAGQWEERGRLALVGIGVEPGLSDIFARHAADTLFREINERIEAGTWISSPSERVAFACECASTASCRGPPDYPRLATRSG